MDRYKLAIGVLVTIIFAAVIPAGAIWFWPYGDNEVPTTPTVSVSGPTTSTSKVEASVTVEQLDEAANAAFDRRRELETKLEASQALLVELKTHVVKQELQEKITQLEGEVAIAKATEDEAYKGYFIAKERQKVEELFAPETAPAQ